MKEHRCSADRRKVVEALQPLLPGHWQASARDTGVPVDGTGYIKVESPDGWCTYFYCRQETGRGWHTREALRLAGICFSDHRRWYEDNMPRL